MTVTVEAEIEAQRGEVITIRERRSSDRASRSCIWADTAPVDLLKDLREVPG